MRTSRRMLLLTGLAAFVLQAGCTTYTLIEPTEVGEYDVIRLKTTDGNQEDLRTPGTVADTIVGLRSSGDTLRVSFRRVEEVSVGKVDVWKTVAVGVAVLVVATGISAYMFSVAMEDCCL